MKVTAAFQCTLTVAGDINVLLMLMQKKQQRPGSWCQSRESCRRRMPHAPFRGCRRKIASTCYMRLEFLSAVLVEVSLYASSMIRMESLKDVFSKGK